MSSTCGPYVTVDFRIEKVDLIFNETECVFVRTSYRKAGNFMNSIPRFFFPNLYNLDPLFIIVNEKESWHQNSR